MLCSRIIPCLDTAHGRVVKGVRFSSLRDAGCPEELASLYQSQGADELVVLDISATPDGRGTQLETVKKVRAKLSIPLTTGGGVRTAADAGALLESGADKVTVNTAAVVNPALLGELASLFGRQCTIVAIDAARRADTLGGTLGGTLVGTSAENPGWEVVVRSGRERTGIDAVSWAREVEERGGGEILLTSWDRDGTRSGYDLELIKAVSDAVSLPIIASGGADTPQHLVEAIEAGASAVLAASIFHYGDYTVATVKQHLVNKGITIRL